MKILVVGGGKIGLPLAAQFATRGASVTVADISLEVVAAINAGRAPFTEPGLDERLEATTKAKRLSATTATKEAAADATMIVIVVPALLTPDRDIDWGNLVAASREVAKGMKRGVLVSYETTVPIGGTREHLRPVLEQSGLAAGTDFHLCFSPERVKSKHIFEHLTKTPKVVGGINAESSRRGAELYAEFLGAKSIDVGSLEAAEFVKLAGMIYRDANIALANELAAYAEGFGLDGPTVFQVANTDNETSMLFPGIGVGGHCTPVYPYFLIRQAERRGLPHSFALLARKVNEAQPGREIDRLGEALGSLSGKFVHLLGLGFRPDIKEHAFSPAFSVRDELSRRGAHVTLEDPLYTASEIAKHGFAHAVAGRERMDAIVLVTSHRAFVAPDVAQWKESGVKAVLDGRNLWPEALFAGTGIVHLRIGVGVLR